MSLPLDTTLGIVGVGTALPGLIQITLECCSRLSELYTSYMQTDTDADELWLLLDLLQSQVPADLHFLSINSARLQPEIVARLAGILRVLSRNLGDAIDIFNSVLGSQGDVKRRRWVLEVKPKLADLVPKIEAWQRRFLDHVQLLRFTGFGFQEPRAIEAGSAAASGKSVVDRLSREILRARISEIPADALEMQPLVPASGKAESIMNTSLKTLLAQDPSKAGDLLIECRRHEQGVNVGHLKGIVSVIARTLAAAGSESQITHLLHAVGYSYLPHPSREFQLLLKYPAGMGSPQTLREMLLQDDMPSINARLDLCRQAATAVFYTHTSGLVHKSIRPEAFLIFKKNKQPVDEDIGTLYLTGFELAREDKPDSFSSMRGSTDWEQQIYTHPSRHAPGTRYTMAHDIYSLGVNMLEIALWQSFLRFDALEQRMAFNDDGLGGEEICKDLRRGVPTAGVRMKSLYEGAARDALRFAMGNRFRDIVVHCLGIVEEMGGVSGQGASNEEAIGLRYIDGVMGSLDEIQI